MLEACRNWDRQAEAGQPFLQPSMERLHELAKDNLVAKPPPILLEHVQAAAAGNLQPLQDWWWLEQKATRGYSLLPAGSLLAIWEVAASAGLVHLLCDLRKSDDIHNGFIGQCSA